MSSDHRPSNRPLDLLDSRADQGAAAARAEERRASAVQLVNSLFRLVKVLRIHEDSNQATVALIDGMAAAIRDYCEKCGSFAASILFADDTVFVNGQMLRASRETYATALELGTILDKCGASEITFERSTGAPQVSALARGMMAVMRNQAPAEGLLEGKIPGIRLRRIRQSLGQAGDRMDRASSSERVLRSYASTVVVLRAYLAELAEGRQVPPNRVRRVAQRLVVHVDEEPHLLARIAVSRPDERDDAMLAVHAAMLALVMARRLTGDRVLLAALVTSALLFDAAAIRLRHKRADAGPLTEQERDRLPASGVVMLTALGRIQSTSIVRTVLSFEALWARRAARRGPVYRGRVPTTVLAGVIATARAFEERLYVEPTARPRVDEVLQAMIQGATDEGERLLVRLLLAALGLVPGGTPVRLSSGEEAVVAGAPTQAVDAIRPPVRIVRDALGRALPKPVFLDLAAVPPRGQPDRWIAAILSPA